MKVFTVQADYSQHSFRARLWAHKSMLSSPNYMLFQFKYFSLNFVAIFPSIKHHIVTCAVIMSKYFVTLTHTVLLLIETSCFFNCNWFGSAQEDMIVTMFPRHTVSSKLIYPCLNIP